MAGGVPATGRHGSQGGQLGTGPPGWCGVEHLSITVADLEQATEFFRGFFGCRVLYTMGPFEHRDDPFMRMIANADVRSVVHAVRVLRSPFLNIELFQATSPRQRQQWPDLHDVGGWSLSACVDDLDQAMDFARRQDVYLLGSDDSRCECMTRFGMHFSLTQSPDLGLGGWNPCSRDLEAGLAEDLASAVPGFRGFERLAVTVADGEEAVPFFESALGHRRLGTTPSRTDGRPDYRAWANVDIRARPAPGILLSSPNLNLELVPCPPYPGQERTWPGMFDVGGWHLAYYVTDMDRASAHLAGEPVHLLGQKKPAYHYEAGEGAYTLHAMAPFGFLFELVSYPHGRFLEDEHAGPAWHPASLR